MATQSRLRDAEVETERLAEQLDGDPCGWCLNGVVYDDFEGAYFPCPNCQREHLHVEAMGATVHEDQEWDDFEGNAFVLFRGRSGR